MSASVLILDDSLTVRMDLSESFEHAGFRVLPCRTVAEARELIAREPIALAILDVLLPDGDGIELLEELRGDESTRPIPILVLSSETEVSDRVRGLRTGADDYVGKPYDSAYVVARARSLLQGARVGPKARPDVLIVDDSPTFREALGASLSSNGYDVLSAGTGEEGLRLASARRPSAIIVDGVMPGMDGLALIRRVRLDENLRGTPCILLTASEDSGAELKALDSGADAFARKEEDLELIRVRLAAVLRSSRSDGQPEAQSAFGARRVLVVDDSETFVQEVSMELRGEGYDVVPARSGIEALEMLAIQPVDCILLDLLMPGLSGQETCRRIKSSPVVRDIPLIVVTSMDGRDAMLEGLAMGADDYVAKSSEIDVLKARVRAQLRRKQFEEEHRRVRDQLLRREIEASEARAARELAETKTRLADELARKNKELEAFSYSVSHDLRAPLRSIHGFSDALLEDYLGSLDERGQGYLRRVQAAAKRMGELIDDLLLLSRVSRAELNRADVDLVSVARSVFAELVRREPERSVELVCPDVLMARADARLVRVVFDNLLGNAWKFTAKSPTARVELGSVVLNGELVFFLRDNGAGFDQTYANRLFQPFQRLHSEAEFSGTGIGLATVHRVLDRHGGRVWAEGRVGYGATIYFTLPTDRAKGRG